MGNLFWSVVKISLYTTPLILILLLPFFRKGYPAKWRRWIWLALALRLIIPTTISIPIFKETPPISVQGATAMVQGNGMAQPLWTDLLPRLMPLVWLMGVVVFILIQGVSYLSFFRKLKGYAIRPASAATQAQFRDIAWEMKILDPPRLMVCSKIHTPTLIGLGHPILLLPHDGYAPEEVTFILRHELVHHKRYDLWYKAFLTMVNALHWFNPLVYILSRQASHDIELSCDEAVLKGLDSANRASYGRLMLNTLPLKGNPTSSLITSFGGVKCVMEKRLRNLFAPTVKGKGLFILCSILTLSILSGGTFTAIADGKNAVIHPGHSNSKGMEEYSIAIQMDSTPSDAEITFHIDAIEPNQSVCLGSIETTDGVSFFQPNQKMNTGISIGFDVFSNSKQVSQMPVAKGWLNLIDLYFHNDSEETITDVTGTVTIQKGGLS